MVTRFIIFFFWCALEKVLDKSSNTQINNVNRIPNVMPPIDRMVYCFKWHYVRSLLFIGNIFSLRFVHAFFFFFIFHIFFGLEVASVTYQLIRIEMSIPKSCRCDTKAVTLPCCQLCNFIPLRYEFRCSLLN